MPWEGDGDAVASAVEAFCGFRDAREDRTELAIHWKDDDAAFAAMFDGGPVAYPWSIFAPDVRANGRIPCVSRPLPHRPRLRVPGRVRVRHGGEAVTFGDSTSVRSGQLHLALATLPQKVFLPAVQSSNLKSR
jgi:hypothetical protein